MRWNTLEMKRKVKVLSLEGDLMRLAGRAEHDSWRDGHRVQVKSHGPLSYKEYGCLFPLNAFPSLSLIGLRPSSFPVCLSLKMCSIEALSLSWTACSP